MDPLAIGMLTFAITLAGAFLGWWVGRRVPSQHLNADSRDVIKVAMAEFALILPEILEPIWR